MQKPNMPRLRFRIGLVLIAGALFFAGCNALKLGGSTDDKAITTQVQAKFFDDPVLKMRDIHVTSDKGTVTLSGAVSTDLEKAAVERIAGQADGVKTVVNQLIVSSAGTAATPETLPPAQTGEATPPQLPTPTSARSERARASGRRHHAASTSSDEAAADQASANEAPAPNPPAMTAQDTPPAAAPAAPAAPPAPPAPVVKPPEQITIPSGTILSVRMIDNIDSARNHAGDDFAASVEAPMVVGDRVVIPRNSDARVRLVQASSAGHMSGRSDLKVELVSVTAGGQTYQLETSYHEQAGASRGTRTAETVGGGAVLGALIGALAGRGRGAAIGSAVGAGAGTAAQAGTSGQQVKIPSETKLDFTLKSPATITLNPAP
jgi:hypothetical protein